MKFIYADSLDYIDPGYDFERDEFSPNRTPYWDDQFAHEFFASPPYDGLLVTRALLGGSGGSGKYTEGQSMRFVREGAAQFFRFTKTQKKNLQLFGDCGAFTYHEADYPPYTPREMVEFYQHGGFTHGCSVDHIIFQYGEHEAGTKLSKNRFNITLDLAKQFYDEHKSEKGSFTPIGVVQGWSPESLAESALSLLKMGYRYLAIGGLVPLRIDAIREAVGSVNQVVKKYPSAKMHLLGFAKADHIAEFSSFRIASFDSTSPLLRAFKDKTKNYWATTAEGELEYYTAVRVPQASGNTTLKNRVKRGEITEEELRTSEQLALSALRAYDKEQGDIEETLDQVMRYSAYLLETKTVCGQKLQTQLDSLREQYYRTLASRIWDKCDCKICRDCSIEVILFRASNRNKRRGMHNLHSFHNYVKTQITESP